MAAFPIPEPEALSCAVSTTGKDAWVIVAGEIDLASAPLLAGALRRAEGHRRNAVVDLSGVVFMDCCGVTVLLEAQRRVKARGGQLVVLDGVSGIVARLLGILAIEDQFDRPARASVLGVIGP